MIRCLAIPALCLLTGALAAADSATAAAAPAGIAGYAKDVVASFGFLFVGALQLVFGLVMIAFAIRAGLLLLSKLLGGLDIWGEVKKRNVAVALVAAGVVISYTGVVGSGIDSMSKPIAGLVSLDHSAWLRALTGIVSSLIQLAIAITVASFAITVTFKVLDRLTSGIEERAELVAGNVALGVLYAGVIVGVSQVVGSAISGVGLALHGFLTTLLRPLIG